MWLDFNYPYFRTIADLIQDHNEYIRQKTIQEFKEHIRQDENEDESEDESEDKNEDELFQKSYIYTQCLTTSS